METTRRRIKRDGETIEVPEGDSFEVRDGDVLDVAYPEVTLPLRAKYAVIRIGGMRYRRTLRAGDKIEVEHDRIYSFLKARAERDAVAAVKQWNAEFGGDGR